MFRKSILAGAVALSLAGCGTTSPISIGPLTPASVPTAAVAACGFLPTLATVANIIAANNSTLSTATAVASAICAAVVGAKGGRLGGATPNVNGVQVHGRFVS